MTLDDEFDYMRLAIDEARKSVSEPNRLTTPKVGAIVVRDGKVLASAFRGELGDPGKGDHAEFCLLHGKLKDDDLSGATLYTTLEPCTLRGEGKTPCAQRIIQAGIAEVVIGMYDPNPRIYRFGWKTLKEAGVRLRDFPKVLREEIRELNEKFVMQYRQAEGDEGEGVRFDYTKNNGAYLLKGATIEVGTSWTSAGRGIIYAYDGYAQGSRVAHARFAHDFHEIDDPGALDYSSHHATIREGEVAVFEGANGYALVRVRSVLAGPNYGDDHYELVFDYQLRRMAKQTARTE